MNIPAIVIAISTIIFGSPGETHHLANQTVDQGAIGATCTVAVESYNNESIHPGTNVLVTSGGNTVLVPDVENGQQSIYQGQGVLVLADTVDVSVSLGADGVMSGGFEVQLQCEKPAPPTTTTTVPPTTTTTTEPPPPVEECFDAGGYPYTHDDPYDDDCGVGERETPVTVVDFAEPDPVEEVIEYEELAFTGVGTWVTVGAALGLIVGGIILMMLWDVEDYD